jgi:hypothetical protein
MPRDLLDSHPSIHIQGASGHALDIEHDLIEGTVYLMVSGPGRGIVLHGSAAATLSRFLSDPRRTIYELERDRLPAEQMSTPAPPPWHGMLEEAFEYLTGARSHTNLYPESAEDIERRWANIETLDLVRASVLAELAQTMIAAEDLSLRKRVAAMQEESQAMQRESLAHSRRVVASIEDAGDGR